MIPSVQMIERRRSREEIPMEHDRRRPDPQARFNRLRTWETLIVAALLIGLALALSTVARAADSWTAIQACYALELPNSRDNGTNELDRSLGAGHGAQCRQSAAGILAAIHEDGLSCSYVVMYHVLVTAGTDSGGSKIEVNCMLYGGQTAWYVTHGGKYRKE